MEESEWILYDRVLYAAGNIEIASAGRYVMILDEVNDRLRLYTRDVDIIKRKFRYEWTHIS